MLYTDGVTDVRPPHLLTAEDMEQIVARAGSAELSATDIADNLGDAIDRELSFTERSDDIAVLTPQETGMYGAITSFRIAGCTTEEDNEAIADHLLDQYRIFTVAREGAAGGACVRVTPALYTTAEQVNRFGSVLREVTDRFRR